MKTWPRVVSVQLLVTLPFGRHVLHNRMLGVAWNQTERDVMVQKARSGYGAWYNRNVKVVEVKAEPL